MRLLVVIASIWLFAFPAMAVTSITEPPTCGAKCIRTTIQTTGLCEVTDTACICTNAVLNAEIETCVFANCTIREALGTQKYSYDLCGRKGEDRTHLVWIMGITFGAVGLVAFALRCMARLHMGTQTWGLDDWAMCLVMCFMIPLCVLSVPLAQHGLGLDMWNVDFDDITSILYLYFWDELFYITSLALTKVSILLFYLKVFPKRSFRICVYILIGLNIAYALGYDLVLIFQCSPIDGAWRSWDGEYNAKCISINILGWSAAAINIALDLGTIILPLPELFQLSMSMKKKVQILLMFAVGFFVTVVSAIRLRSLIEFGTTSNVTQDYVEVGYWSTIEVPVGVICACMPAIRSLFSQVFPAIFGTTRRGHSEYGYGGSRGYASKKSGKPPQGSTGGNTQIRVKQEWTVMSNVVDNRSDVELRSFEQQIAGVETHTNTSGKDIDEWPLKGPKHGSKGSHGSSSF
ncbi:hypothetical protein JX265_006334 [Neoarthrinium moseri]|uniref:CFEM domain-containing protein n=1 Tax=Neoarthrinium moseri TaxID=1658444 RepID=A0A9P9WMF0_9PEZI|nr:uncharacterized protein JN550_008276 [Neoarthrinium moseri]KAI1852284.1 hypothetical protein JX266_002462 [Neoarthrinium moseri]KAI1865519.1 hypothetical protein JN550_008276 [Neoarthrinium moseri]KAI1870164.1 hypothetical protein JX265_006334 [Neoarthrinium moseri]